MKISLSYGVNFILIGNENILAFGLFFVSKGPLFLPKVLFLSATLIKIGVHLINVELSQLLTLIFITNKNEVHPLT